MKVFVYSSEQKSPFSGLFDNLGLPDKFIISNQEQYVEQFSKYQAQLMDLVGDETDMADKSFFVPIEVKDIFLEWLKNNQHGNWRPSRVSSELAKSVKPQSMIGEDELNQFLERMNLEEEWEKEPEKNGGAAQQEYQAQSKPKSHFFGWLKNANVIFALVLLMIIWFGVNNNLWLDKRIIDDEQQQSQSSEGENDLALDSGKTKELVDATQKSSSYDSQSLDVIMLFDQTSSVVPSNTQGESLVPEIAKTVNSLFTQETKIDSNLWSIEQGDENNFKQALQSKEAQLHLISFGGAELNNSVGQCQMYFLTEKSLSSSSSTLLDEIKYFYRGHIHNTNILKDPAYESPQLAQWQAWKNFQRENPQQQNYYQILVTDGGKLPEKQQGDCLNDSSIDTRLNEWSKVQREDLLVLKYQGLSSRRQNLTMTLSKISYSVDYPAKTEQRGDILSSLKNFQEQVKTQSNFLTEQIKYTVNNLWVLIAAILVILMQAGFALVEAGFNASKNVVNIMFKNVMDFSLGVLSFFIIGFTLMFGHSYGLFGFDALMLIPEQTGDLSPYIFFLFQAAFAATAATICAGSVAGRLRFEVYLIYSVVITAFVYPISGHWVWGGGWLNDSFDLWGWFPGNLAFHDFAGSVVVHAVGGFAGLAGALVLGSRVGKFENQDVRFLKQENYTNLLTQLDDRRSELFPHNLLLAALGMLILWIGWYGFNGGSEFAIYGESVDRVAKIAVNTTLAAATGAVVVMLLAWWMYEKPELTLMLNGAIGGLVAITASCDIVTFKEAILIGGIAGVVVIWGIEWLTKREIDDPVGAWPVHGLCGIWGGMTYGIFGYAHYFWVQIFSSLIIPLWSFLVMLLLFWTVHQFWQKVLKKENGIRVPVTEELRGLDEYHHGETGIY